MNKAELIEALVDRTGLKKQDAKKGIGSLHANRNRSFIGK